MALISFFGVRVSQALLASVKSFTVWQKFLQINLSEIGAMLLPAEIVGIYQKVVAQEHKPDLVDSREAIVTSLITVWALVCISGVLFSLSGIMAAIYPSWLSFFKSLWD
ncbi:hypothetical protein [Desulforegula conservatrix]|uniref:hypothetical protein n=1 Tax=Desulforegula conservatrix TaxID=153026 RepID=UPI000487C8C4|nr:hypothetical protein [Desulforegula conservatrix]